MGFVRAKRARSSVYIYSKKRSFISILLVSTLISTSLGTGVAALENPDQGVQIPALCDAALIAQPVQVSPSPTPTPTETSIENPETSPSPTPEIIAPTPEPTPTPEVTTTPEVTPAPTPTPSPEFLSGDYVAPIIPAAEFSTTIRNSEVEVSPKIICPSPVTNVIARPQNTQLEISWIPGVSAEPNTIENITDYYVKVLETAQVIKVSADRTSTTISGLTNGTSYSIIVYAASEYGSSIASELVTAIPLSGNEGEVAGIIVEFKPEANVEQGQLDVPGEELVTQVELTIENKITEDVHVVEFSEATTLEEAKTIANEISQDPQVVWAEPDQFVYTSAQEVINDPNYSTDQWNLWDKYGIGIGQSNKEMTTAWSLTAGQGINVAVIDTGITSHPDLDSQVIPGFDFVSDPEFLKAAREENGPQVSFDGDYVNSEKYGSLGWDDNPTDPGDWRGVGPVRNSTWHGTHIAGVIAAQSENQEGIAGIAPGAKIQPIRALSWRGGLLSDIASSITWASGGSVTGVADNPTPAKVINMSFSVNSICPTSLQTAINDAFARGSVLVAAAGNNNDDVKNYAPANCENVISVGASNKDGKRASYSNYGLGLDVSAPGGDANDNGIYSTSNAGLTEPASFGYSSQQGTSISAAHVSAIAARIFSANPTFNPTEVKSQITSKESVREFADTQCDINADIYCGEGIISLFQVASAYGSMLFAATSTSNLTVPNSADFQFGTGNFTVEWWQYQTDTQSWPRVFEARQSGSTVLGVSLESQTFYWWRPGGWSCGQTIGNVKSSWNHFAVVRSSGTTTVYKNGTLVCSFLDSYNYLPDSSLRIGTQEPPSAGTYFGGNITGFHVIKGTAQYTANFTVRTSPPTTVANSKLLLNAVSSGTLVSDSAGLKTVTNNSSAVTWSSMTPFTNFAPTIASATISGTQKIGSTLTATANTVTGTPVPTTTYQWQYSANGSSWTNIPTSGTSSTYAISGTTYRGNYLRVGVTVTNAGGSATAYSDPTALIYYPDCSPTTSTPTVNGVLRNLYSFTTVGTCDWSVPDGVSFADLLVVGGGGGAGGAHDNASSGGGGAGYVYANSSQSISGKIIITVGAGGTGGIGVSLGTFQNGNAGADSVFGSVTALGGAGGLGGYESISGGSCPTYTIPIKGGTAATLIQRATGGQDGCNTRSGFGGGGQNSTQSQSGGTGLASSITGSSITYGTGGAGGTRFSNTSPSAQSSGTGNGGTGANAASSTGRTGGAGGSGIVIVSAVAASPTITAISPSTGSVTAGGSVTITGTNFVSGQTTVTINGVSLTSVSVSSSTTLTATLPTLTVGTHDLVVNNSRASATSAGAFTVIAAPTITSATITGNKVVGETLTATANTVTGASPTLTYEWQSSATSGGTYSAIPSATSSTYVLTSSEATKFIKVKITVTNAGGSANTTSTATTVIVSSCSATSTTPTINGVQMNVKQFLSTPSSCAWVAPSNVTGIEVLVVGGGGGGGSRHGGGGGAGGLVYGSSYSVTAGNSYAVVVGGGGTGSPGATFTSGTNGGNSSFGDSLIAIGGGGGGNNSGSNGGSGGGSQVTVAGGLSTQTSPAGATGYGNNGGSGLAGTCSTSGSTNTGWCGGGGGGAGAVGGAGYRNSSSSFGAGSGGIGRQYSITGTPTFYAGGGGGGTGDGVSVTPSTGGQGGGGAGGFQANGTNGLANTGGGGGGAGHYGGGNYIAGNGGSGIVVIAYASAPTVSAISPTSGAISGDVSVTITGTNFIAGSTVTIGGVSLSSVSVVSGTSITGTISANSLTAGVKDVVVTTTSGTSTGGTGLYEAVSKSTPSLSSISNVSKTYGDSTFSITTPTATVSGSTIAGSVSYSSSNTAVASVSGSTVTVVGVGTATFTATFTPTNTSLYNTTTTTFTITVAAKTLTISAEAKSKSFGATTPTNSYTLSTTLVGSDAISSLTYTYSGTNSTTAPTAVGSYTITPSSVVFSTGSASNYSITYAAGSYTIGLATQSTLTVSSTSGTFGSALTLTTSGGTGSGSVTYSATTGTATSCTVSGDSLTAGSAGTCFVTATKAADSQYSSISSTSTTVSFAKANQSSLSMTSASSVTYGNTLALTSTGGSGTGSTSYAVSSGTCTISGSTLTPGDAGSTCIITATKAADTNYNSVTTSTQTITINKATQSTLTIDSSSTVAFGSTLTLSTTGGSGTGSVTYSKTGTCTISGSTLTPGDAGSSCVVTATKALDTNYNAISSATQTITITKINQSALSMASASTVAFGSTLTLSTTGGSGTGSTTYAVSSGTCTILGSTLTPGDAGSTCIITATKAADTNYNSITTSTQTITTAKINQSALTISSTSGTFGTALTLTTSGGSGTGSVTYAATTGTASSCTVSGTSLSAGSAGTCLVTATKAADTNYLSASSVQTTVTFAQAAQSTLTVSSTSGTFGTTLTLTTSGGTGTGSVAYAAATGTSSSCTVSGTSLTAGSAGTCLVTATKAADTNYLVKSSTQTTVTFAQASQSTLTLSSTSGTFGTALTLTTSGGSGTGSVTYAASAGTASSCTVSGTSLTAGSSGTCLVTATKAADTNYLSVSSVQTTVTFAKANQSSLSISSTSGTFGSALTLTTSGGTTAGSVLYSVSDGTATGCSESGGSLTVTAAGTCLVTATMAGSGSYETVSSSQTTITFAQASQSTLTVSSTSGTYGSALTLTTSGGSGTGSVTYAAATGTASSCTVSGTSLTAGSAGTCLVTATKAADTNYSSKASSQTTVTFAQASQSTLTVSSTSGTFGTALTLTTSGGSGTGSVTYAASTGTASSCTVSGTSLTAGSAGTCLVTATKAADTNYSAVSSTQTTVTFAQAAQSTLTVSSTSGTYGSALTLTTSGGSGTGSVTYAVTTGTASTCTESGGSLTAGSAGTCLVTATKASDTNYLVKSSTQTTVTFSLAAPTIASATFTGGNAVGETLTASANTVTGFFTTTTYQWQSATAAAGTYSNISSATSSTYVLTSTELSRFVRVVITVTNTGGTVSATSSSTPVIVAAQSSWALLAAGLRTSVFAATGSNLTTLNNGTYFYNNSAASIGFAPNSTISQSSADTRDSGTCTVANQGNLRLSWHRSSGNISGGWRYGCTTGLNGSTTIFRAVYQSNTLPSYYPSGPQLNVSTSTLQSGGWSLCYAGTYGTSIAFDTVSASCTGTYLLLSGGPGVILTTPTLSGFSNTSALFSESTKAITAPTASVAGTFSYSSSNTSVASFASASTPTATLVGVGTATITATFTPTDTANYSSTTTTMTLTISQGNQSTLTISSTSGTYGTDLTLTTSGGSGTGSVSYAAATGTASSCTVSGTSLTAGSAGTCLVTATKASSTNYLSISSTQTTVTFAKASQSTLTVSTTSGTFGTDLTLTTSGGSGTGSVSYAAATGTASSCTVSGTSLTAGSAGTCLVTATKASDTNYLVKSSSQTTVTFAQLSQSTLTVSSTSGTFGSALTLTTSGGLGTGSITFAAATGTASSCTVSGTSLTAGSAGTCLVTATKASSTDYLSASSTQTTVTFAQASQSTLTVSSTSGTFGSALTLTTSGGSGTGSVTYAATTGTASSCTVSGTSLTAGSAGTCLVTATKATSTNYLSASSVQTTITFAKANQSSLTISTTSGSFGTPLTLSTSGGTGDGAVTYVATPGTATSCSISGSTLTAGSGGTCLVTATKASNINYNSISSSQTTVTFGKRAIVLSSFTDISNKTYGDSTFTLTAPTVAGSVAGAFAYASGTTSVATISGSTVTIAGAGTSTITATFTPTDTASYENQTITMLLTVNKKAITVTAVDKSKIYAASAPSNSFTNSTLVGSDAISSLTYTYSGTNSTTAPTTVGNYTITPSSASFSAGSSNNYTITYVPGAYSITKATPTFSGFNNVSKTYGNLPFTITAPTVSGSLAGSFTYSSSDTTAVTISSTTATVAGSGSSLITASFTPTDTTNYNSATTTMTVSVAKATQNSLSITSSSSVNYGSTISLTTSGGSGTGAISYAVTSGTCSISSTTLTPGNAGSTCVIQATKALDANYNVATSSTQSITTSKLSQTVSFTSTAPSSPVSGDTYTPLATASSGAIPTISIDASSSSVCEINAGIVTFNSSGTCLIEADSASSTNYNAATTASQSITVAKIAQTITFTQPSASSFGDSSRSMSATSSSGLALTYSRGASTTNTACSVSTSGVVTILAVGNCQVTAAQSGNSQYDSAVSVSRTFAVNAIVPSAPFITSVSAGNASATVSFSAPSSNGGATLSAYELVAMPSSGSNVTKSNCSTSASPLACTITGLSNGVSYTFKVAAINSAGTGTYSTTSGSFTPATVANSVVNLVAQPGDGSLIVNWDQPTNLGGGTFTRYDIYYKSTGSYSGTANKQISTVTDTTWTFTGLANGTSYDVKVVAITSANASELSGNTAEVSQYPSTVASAPTNVSVSKLTATSARISWGLPLTDGGASLDATTPYVVTITGGPSAITCSALSGRTCDISGLNPASTYSISVKAQNRMGLGTAGTATYLVPSNDANLLSMDLKTGTTLSDLATANYSPSFDANTTSYSISVTNSQAYARITPSVNEPTATIKVNGVTVSSGSPRNLSLGIGSNVFTLELTAGDLVTTKTYSLTITRPKASQTPISITSSNSVNYGSTITLTTTGGSGNGLISFTTTGTCTTSFSGGNYILTPGDVGSSCAIVATKAADDDFFVANSASQTITINKTTPTLSGFSNIFKTFGDPTFTISEPTVSGSAPGVFTYSSSNTDVAILTGTTINVAGYGSSTITATFTPTSTTNYNSVIASLVMSVAKKILRVTPSDITKFYGANHPTITNSVTGLVGSDEISSISYTYAGTGSTSYFASTTNPSNTGTYSITPLITSLSSGSLNNYDITYDEAELTISKVNQSALNITSSTSATYGENLTLATSGGSGNGAITITKVSGDCTLNNSGSTYSITPGDAGNTCVVGATKAADTNHNAVSATDQTITIGKANQTLAFTSNSSSPRINDTYTPVVTSRHSSNGTATGITPTISVDISSAAICSISAGVITFDAQGTCLINADADSSSNFNAATTTSQTVPVSVVPSSSARTAAITINTSLIRSNIKNIIEKLLPEIKNPGNIINLPSLNNLNLKPLFPTRAVPILPNNLDTGLAITDNLGRLPLSQPGEKQMKVGNEFVPIVERVSPEGAMTLSMAESMNVAPIEVAIQATDIKGQNMQAPDDGILRAVKGQTITVEGDGLTPGSKYSVWLFSEPTKLGEGIVSNDSTFKQVFMVPDGLPTGSHTLQINGMNSDKKVVSLTTGVIITEVKQIQTISSSNSEIIAWAIIFIFLLLFIIGYLLKYIRKLQAQF